MSPFGPPDVEKLQKRRDLAGLLKATKHESDASVRAKAIDALIWLDPRPEQEKPNVLRTLHECLKDPESKVRSAALGALYAWDGAGSLDTYIEALNDASRDVRGPAAGCLGEFQGERKDERAVSALRRALRDPEEIVRTSAAKSLGRMGDAGAVDALAQALADSSHWVRREAAQALEKLADERAIAPLGSALQDRDGFVRSAAIRGLTKMGSWDHSVTCDLCNGQTALKGAKVYPVTAFRIAVAAGLKPPESALKHAALMGIPAKAAVERWRETVQREDTPWILCPGCQEQAAKLSH